MSFGCGTALIFPVYLSQIAFAFVSNADFERREEPPPPPQPASSRAETIARGACFIGAAAVVRIDRTPTTVGPFSTQSSSVAHSSRGMSRKLGGCAGVSRLSG